MSTTTLLVMLLLCTTGILVMAGAGYIAWRHPRLGIPLTIAVAVGGVFVTAVIGFAALKL